MSFDRAYANLLSHLQRPGSGISLQTVISAIPHYLTQLPLPHPTQFTAFVISSSLWHPLSVHTVGSIVNAYRSAVHLKSKNLQISAHRWFARDPQAILAEWAVAVMKGVSRGNPQLRIAILGGLVLGFNDLGHDNSRIWVRDRLENQVIIACAEILEAITTPRELLKTDSWVSETEDVVGEDRTSLFLYSVYNILPLVATEKVSALDLLALSRLANKGIDNAFSSGQFLSQLSPSITRNSIGQLMILPESSLMLSLQAINKFTLYKDAGHLARLLSRCLSLLADQKPHAAWHTFQDVSRDMEVMTLNVEADWKRSPLAALTSEDDLERETKTLSPEIWKVLKTLLFSHLVVSQAILSSIQYLDPLAAGSGLDLGPSSIACSTLRSLHHLSFVISQFGGVASSAESFKELKRVFYMALDIVAADLDPQRGPTFVRELLSHAQESPFGPGHPFRQSRTAYVLVIVEQLMPTLDDLMIENMVVPFCHSYLTNPEHRETYESAHSVMLSIFTAHSQRKEIRGITTKPSLAERLVPFYVNLLLQDSVKNRLETSQLRTAYSNLVRSAASSGDEAITWLCIDALLEALASHSSSSTQMSLHLTLVSLISCVSLSLLSRLLSEVEKVLDYVSGTDRAELGEAVVEEITHKVGDREKEIVLSWWGRVAPNSIGTQDQAV
ncbi:hypothetical protein JB92DRAFT_3122491 [Gautieria morchelliformis]|nr:hypothetical protein JB92DRAFT_3122491 [Gautieria morchelliformis]